MRQLPHVVWSVCLCVVHTDVLCMNSWTDRDVFWRTDSCGSREPCLRCGRRSNESIRSCEGWQLGDAAFCHITLDTCCL